MTGALLALLVLTDPILGLAGAGVDRGGRAREGDARGRSGRWRSWVLVACVGLLPWTVRNYRVHGEFVAVKSTFGYAFWQGNCALSEGTDKVVRASVERALNRANSRLDLRGAQRRALGGAGTRRGTSTTSPCRPPTIGSWPRSPSPSGRGGCSGRAVADLRAEPGRYARLCLRRLRYFVLFDETNPKTRSLVYRAGHLGLTALAVVGFLLARPETRRRLGPTVVTAALIAAFHALTIVSARFHIPIEPLMAVWAACGLTRWETPESAAAADDVEGVGVVRRLHRRGRCRRVGRGLIGLTATRRWNSEPARMQAPITLSPLTTARGDPDLGGRIGLVG